MKHGDLVLAAERWLYSIGCGFVFRELVSLSSETPDAIGFKSGYSVLVECKVSRADYLKDKKKWFRKEGKYGMGQFRYFLCPEGLIKSDELPERWGLLYANERGRVTCVVNKTKRGHHLPSQPDWQHEYDHGSERALFYTALRRIQLRGLLETIYDQPWKTKQEQST